MANPTGKGGFQERKHQINRRGRPKTHDKLRELIQKLAWESVGESDVTRLELLLRSMLTSKSAADRENILRHGWGDVPKEIELSGNKDKPLVIKAFDYGAAVAAIATGPGADSDAPGEGEGHFDGPPLGEIVDGR